MFFKQFQVFSKLILLAFLSFVLVSCGGKAGDFQAGTDEVNNGISVGTGDDNSAAVISFDESAEQRLVLRGQPGTDTTLVSFIVSDLLDNPIGNVRVNFSIDTNVGGVGIVGNDFADTDSDGVAAVILQSGTIPTTVSVTAMIASSSVAATSDAIAISSGTVYAGAFNFRATFVEDSVEAIDNGTIGVVDAADLVNIPVDMEITVADQFGQPVFEGAGITFVSSDGEGVFLNDSCAVVDTGCGTTWFNLTTLPEGGIVSVLAYASGTEEFEDINGNGIYDPGLETFIDLPEQFLDQNENGAYDQGEFFVDDNQDGVFNAVGNGVWDGPCAVDSVCEGQGFTTISRTLSMTLLPRDFFSSQDE